MSSIWLGNLPLKVTPPSVLPWNMNPTARTRTVTTWDGCNTYKVMELRIIVVFLEVEIPWAQVVVLGEVFCQGHEWVFLGCIEQENLSNAVAILNRTAKLQKGGRLCLCHRLRFLILVICDLHFAFSCFVLYVVLPSTFLTKTWGLLNLVHCLHSYMHEKGRCEH